MEEDLVEFLRSRKIPNGDILRMQTDKVDKAVLSIMTDVQMASYLPSYGDRVATLSFCRRNNSSTNKEELLHRLREKMGKRKMKSKITTTQSQMDNEKPTTSGVNTTLVKTTRVVEIGWLDFNQGDYHQIRTRNGGGTRRMSLEKTSTMEKVLDVAKGLFFPNGKSTKGPIEDFTFSICDFKNNPLPANVTVAEMYEQTKLKLLRFYLCSKESTYESSSEVQEDGDSLSQTFSDEEEEEDEEEDLQASSSDSDVREVVYQTDHAPVTTVLGSHINLSRDQCDRDMKCVKPVPKKQRTSETAAAERSEGHIQSTPSDHGQKSSSALDEDVIIDFVEASNPEVFSEHVHEHSYSAALGMDDTLEWTPGDHTGESDDDTVVIVTQQDHQEEKEEVNNEEVPVPTDLPKETQRISVRRVKIVDDLLAVFMHSDIMDVNLKMEIVNENAVDAAGVSREIYTAFWEQFLEYCEGENERVPRLRPDFGDAEWQAVGRIWIKGLLDHGVMPVRLCKAFILACVHGIDSVDENILMSSFLNYLPLNERSAVESALKNTIDESNEDDLLDLFTRMGSHSLPSKNNFKEAIETMAHKAILQEPKFVIDSFTIPMAQAKPNFSDKSSVLALYESKQPTGKRVAQLLDTPQVMSQREQATFSHLQRYIKSVDQTKAGKILRFCTGSSVICVEKIAVCFNVETGLNRRPIGHTCSATLEMPCTYSSYPEFRTEFDNILSSDYFEMDIL